MLTQLPATHLALGFRTAHFHPGPEAQPGRAALSHNIIAGYKGTDGMAESLGEILSRMAGTLGQNPAVAEPGRSISYAELDRSAEQIAAAIRKLGVPEGSRIAIFRRKSIETVVALYAALKAQCAYVPADPRTGSERLAMILRDADPALVFTEPALAPQLRPSMEGKLIDWVAGLDSADDLLTFRDCRGGGPRLPAEVGANAGAAYILYTSGSTGVPKGVEHTHSSAIAFASWAAGHFQLTSNDRLSCHAPLHFDLTTFDLFAALLRGSCVVLVPENIVIFPHQVGALIEKAAITVWYSVPFALVQLVEHGNLAARNLSTLREIIFAGERYPPPALRKLAAAVPHVRLTNLFGPTETNVCTFHQITSEDLASDEFCPIGKPCPYASILIVDAAGNKVRPAEQGELYVGGLSVMRGYLNREDLNKEVFTYSADGTRFFRTGDLVAEPKQGPLRFYGRLDKQVKVRGFRVELGEIEAALLRCPGVMAGAAWIDMEENGFASILAAVERSDGISVTEELLLRDLGKMLASASVPRRIFIVDKIPRLLNDKIDSAALPRLAEEYD